MAILLLIFILVGSLTVMNMLLGALAKLCRQSTAAPCISSCPASGVLVEAIKTVSTIEREQLEVDFAKRVLWEMISKGPQNASLVLEGCIV